MKRHTYSWKIVKEFTDKDGIIHIGFPSSGDKMDDVTTFDEMQCPNNGEYLFIQPFQSYSRVSNDNINWNLWNGTVTVDVDYKVYVNNHSIYTKPEKIFSETFNYLQDNFSQHFYYAEVSRSGNSFHYIFGMNTDFPSEERRNALYKLSCAIIIYTFKQLGYYNEIKYSIENENRKTQRVLDTCMDRPTQGCFLTGKGQYNPNYNPEWRVIAFNDDVVNIIHELTKDVTKPKNKNNKLIDSNYIIKLDKTVNKRKVSYIDHDNRRALFRSLSRLYSGDELRTEWIKCAKLIPDENGHTTEYYINAPYTINDWNDKLNGDEYCDVNLLKVFGYHVTFEKKKNNTEIISKIYDILNHASK